MTDTVLITGANRGIGLRLVREYLDRGANVLAACRTSSSDLDTTGATVIEGIDVGQDEVVGVLSNAVDGHRVDILWCNAGILRQETLNSLDYDSIRQQFEVNSLGPLRVVEAVLPNMAAGGRIALMTSRMGSIDDNSSGSRYGYRMSKVALNMAGVSLAKDLESRGIAVGIYHPGFVQTDMVGGMGDITPEQAAERLVQRVDELKLTNTGTFWHSSGEILPW